jgi:CRP/FNR family transcriptional regulator, cyclic AMP receptor protein
VITRLEKATMLATIHDQPEFSELLMSYLLTRNSRIEEDLIDQLFNSSESASPGSSCSSQTSARKERRSQSWKVQSGNAGRDDRHDPITGELFHEQIPQVGFYRL